MFTNIHCTGDKNMVYQVQEAYFEKYCLYFYGRFSGRACDVMNIFFLIINRRAEIEFHEIQLDSRTHKYTCKSYQAVSSHSKCSLSGVFSLRCQAAYETENSDFNTGFAWLQKMNPVKVYLLRKPQIKRCVVES